MKKNNTWNPNERAYRKMMTAIGGTMLIFLALFTVGSVLIGIVNVIALTLPMSQAAAEVFYQLFYAAIYLLIFMLPVAFLKLFVKKTGFEYQPMKADIRLPLLILPIILGGIVLIMAQASINASIVNIFNYNSFVDELLGTSTESLQGYQIVLQFIVIALVPAFCEEFLFRGAILTNCLHFGRTNAILISSLLFGLMHQNAAQFLYAFAAGIFLGAIYERTGSIWPGTFLHMANNSAAIVINVFSQKLGEQRQVDVAWMILEGALYLVGMICIAILVARLAPKKERFENGVFGKSVPASDEYARCPVTSTQAVRHFLNFPMVLFLAFAILQALVLVLLSMLYGPVL